MYVLKCEFFSLFDWKAQLKLVEVYCKQTSDLFAVHYNNKDQTLIHDLFMSLWYVLTGFRPILKA
jgi:hypothetical protein